MAYFHTPHRTQLFESNCRLMIKKSPFEQNMNCYQRIRSIRPISILPSVRAKIVKPDRQPAILWSWDDLCQQIRHHLFCHAINHRDLSDCHIAPNQIISDWQMTNIAQPFCIRRDTQACSGIRVHCVRFDARKSEEADNIFGVYGLLASHTCSNVLCRARRIHHDRLF